MILAENKRQNLTDSQGIRIDAGKGTRASSWTSKRVTHVFEQMDAIKPLGGKALQTTGELIPDPFC